VFNVTNNKWTTVTLSQSRFWLAATSVDNRYALFSGENTGTGPSKVVDIIKGEFECELEHQNSQILSFERILFCIVERKQKNKT
jgi:hypothetical protein